MRRLAAHHHLNAIQTTATSFFAKRYGATKSIEARDIRNPLPGQWKSVLTDECLELIDEKFPDLTVAYGRICCAD